MPIHPTALVDSTSELHESVDVGPFCVIGPGCVIDQGCRIGPYTLLKENVTMGRDNKVSAHSSLGIDPQDLKYADEPTRLVIGDNNDIREYVTLSRGTLVDNQSEGVTRIGSNNVIMAYVHVAHDSVLHNNIIMANAAMIAGHITIEDNAILGGLAAVHQFVRIGAFGFVGGGSMVVQDVPPFHLANGDRAKLFGLNLVGLKRNGFSSNEIAELKRASRVLFKTGRSLSESIEELNASGPHSDHVGRLLTFVRESKRGICR